MVSKAVDCIEVERTVVSKNWRKDIEEKGKEGCVGSTLKWGGIRHGIVLPSKETILNNTMYYKPQNIWKKGFKVYLYQKYENSNNGTYVKCLFTSKHCVEESKYHDVYHRHTIFSCLFERHRLMLPKKEKAYNALTNAHCCVFLLKTRKLPKDTSYIFKMYEMYFQY